MSFPLTHSINVLLIEDDFEMAAMIEEFLSHHRINATVAWTGSEGLRAALEGRFDLVILDIMLPLMNGFDVLRSLRRRSAVPVIMLSARANEQDKIDGLHTGADDYLAKPFSPGELLARMAAVLRRVGRGSTLRLERLEANQVRLNPLTREVFLSDKRIAVTSIEFDILEVLVRSAGSVVSRDDLARTLYNRQAHPTERTLDVHVSHLRRKLAGSGNTIRTVRGSGYLFALDLASPETTAQEPVG